MIDKIQTRSFISNNLEFLIQESIYYRSNNENLNEENRVVIWILDQDKGSANIL